MSFKNVYGGRHATRAAAKIAQRIQYAFTEPAHLVRKEIIALGYGCQIEEKITVAPVCSVTAAIAGLKEAAPGGYKETPIENGATFTVDLFIKEHRICIEVDGIYHLTKKQEAKAAWRDALLIANGYKVVHVDAYYTKNAEWLSKLRVRLSEVLMKMRTGMMTEGKID